MSVLDAAKLNKTCKESMIFESPRSDCSKNNFILILNWLLTALSNIIRLPNVSMIFTYVAFFLEICASISSCFSCSPLIWAAITSLFFSSCAISNSIFCFFLLRTSISVINKIIYLNFSTIQIKYEEQRLK